MCGCRERRSAVSVVQRLTILFRSLFFFRFVQIVIRSGRTGMCALCTGVGLLSAILTFVIFLFSPSFVLLSGSSFGRKISCLSVPVTTVSQSTFTSWRWSKCKRRSRQHSITSSCISTTMSTQFGTNARWTWHTFSTYSLWHKTPRHTRFNENALPISIGCT